MTGGQYDLIEGYFPPGSQTPLHRHTRYSEQLYMLEGEFTVWVGENKVVLSTGQSFLIPVGTPHVIAALSEQPARGLVIAAPSGFARSWHCLIAFLPRLATKFWGRLEPYPPLLQKCSQSITGKVIVT